MHTIVHMVHQFNESMEGKRFSAFWMNAVGVMAAGAFVRAHSAKPWSRPILALQQTVTVRLVEESHAMAAILSIFEEYGIQVESASALDEGQRAALEAPVSHVRFRIRADQLETVLAALEQIVRMKQVLWVEAKGR
ncbi:hypothetical protein N0M98_30250 [Paenibacillus doosanensis]|uniref:ACT domain-containing protein n=1 Tax=Paenibacillus konkukensis TaxID=2020716 RepID=A0ABY4RM97_9BACL|nr:MULTISPECIES: hypothetical protein [Paenibacillus]MCS7464388.1 hypothetical protein [Paenibacillus doosanensis]UQZ83283.1 hypothetical protein SK3146_02467 [Paenibacillus konkukensis]